MKLPPAIREQFRAYGRQGGRTRAMRMSPGSRQIVARQAAIQRWIRARFGAPRFASLGMPGGATIDAGLAALAAGQETIESLLVSLAAPRLEREGVPLSRDLIPDADVRLYRLLEGEDANLAHARYLAYRRQVVSFANAAARARSK